MGKYQYGWKRQAPDQRDRKFTAKPVALPSSVDLRHQCPPIYDQGQYGSCTANAACGAFEFDTLKQGLRDFMPSRMFEYYNTRVLDGDVGEDGGGTIRNANKALNKNGVCTEDLWRYTGEHLLLQPTDACYQEAAPHAITAYMAVNQDLTTIKQTLASGFPIQIGFDVYESFESDQANATGIIPLPDINSETYLGGHAVLIVGYADQITVAGQALSDVFIVRNSWGTGWGDQGYCYVPYAYFTDIWIAGDLWVINAVPGDEPTPTPPPPPPKKDCTAILMELLKCIGLVK